MLVQVRMSVRCMGGTAGPDDCYLALRGMRTLAVRIKARAHTHTHTHVRTYGRRRRSTPARER